MSSPFDPLLITEDKSLTTLCRRLREAGSFAFDTEFVGEDTYTPEVCLIQVATPEFHALIDPLVDHLDLTPFWQLVADPKVEIIVHAGSEDLAICFKLAGLVPANVIDLQIAAGFCGLGYPISLARLVLQTLSCRVHKSQTLTDWRRRPFTPEQLNYAVEDVVYLPDAYRALRDRIEKLGRWDWVVEECDSLCEAAATSADNGQKRLKRLRGTASLTRKQLSLLDAILALRDELARKYDRPPRTVLRDHLAVELARRGWSDIDKMRSLRGLNLSNADLRRFGDAIAEAKKIPPEDWPETRIEETSPEEDVLLAFITAILRAHCDQISLAYSLLATRADIKKLIRASDSKEGSESDLHQGWRAAAVGDTLARVLSGTAAVRVVTEGTARRLIVQTDD